jgi:hypothetical protein
VSDARKELTALTTDDLATLVNGFLYVALKP